MSVALQPSDPHPLEVDPETADQTALELADQTALELAAVLHALGDPMRLRILAQLADGCEHRCGSLSLPITKSTCSHHFRVLREAGVIATRVDGKSRLNRLARDELDRRFPGLLDAVIPRGDA